MNKVDKFNFIKVKKIYISQNTTTIPDELIKKKLLSSLNIINKKSEFKKLCMLFSEIDKISSNFKSIDEVTIKIERKQPVFFYKKDNTLFFLTKNGEQFICYDENKLDLVGIIELRNVHNINLDCYFSYLNFIRENVDFNLVDNIYFKNTDEFVLTMKNKSEIILDKSLEKMKKDVLNKIIQMSIQHKTRIYTRLIADNKIIID